MFFDRPKAVFAKVENGNVYLLDERGGKIGAPWYPPSGGKAVSADYNPSLETALVLTERGVVHTFGKNGGGAPWSGNGHIVSARWMGEKVAVTNQNGSSELRCKRGGWIKAL